MSTGFENWVSNPDETHGPVISVAGWSLCAVSASFLAFRLCIRRNQGKLWIDDVVLGISWILLLIQVILNQLAVNLGLGKHALDVDFSNFESITYYGASGLTVSIFAITLSKISFGVTLLRLTEKRLAAYVYFAIITLALFAIPVAVLPWVLCQPVSKAFVDMIPGTCMDKAPSVKFARFQAIWSALMDLSLAFIPWRILWKVQMRFAEKIGVGIAMSLGVMAGAAAIIRGKYVEQLAQQDLSYDAVNAMVWSIAESAMTIVATSIPVMRVFFKQAVNSAIESYHNSSSRSRSNNNPSSHTSTLANGSLQRSTKRRKGRSEEHSAGSLADVLGKGSKNYLELNDLMVDEKTGRVTAIPESLPDDTDGEISHQP